MKDACAAVGVARSTVYEHRDADEAFAAAWDEIETELVEQMEHELFRRAVEGVEKPVYQGGRLVGAIREFSDQLLMFGLKARKPGTYRENVRVEHSGVDGKPIELSAPEDALDRSERAAALLARSSALHDETIVTGSGNGNGHH